MIITLCTQMSTNKILVGGSCLFRPSNDNDTLIFTSVIVPFSSSYSQVSDKNSSLQILVAWMLHNSFSPKSFFWAIWKGTSMHKLGILPQFH